MSKNFFLAGEMAYFMVNIDNSQCTDDCELIITQWSNLLVHLADVKYNYKCKNKREKFHLAKAGESK